MPHPWPIPAPPSHVHTGVRNAHQAQPSGFIPDPSASLPTEQHQGQLSESTPSTPVSLSGKQQSSDETLGISRKGTDRVDATEMIDLVQLLVFIYSGIQ